MGKVVKMPKRPPPLRCESGDPACGPVVEFDDDGVPLCQKCYEGLEIETLTERRVREMGLRVITTPPEARRDG
jgi:hypothetical protein